MQNAEFKMQNANIARVRHNVAAAVTMFAVVLPSARRLHF
jgi:hypothetical protein